MSRFIIPLLAFALFAGTSLSAQKEVKTGSFVASFRPKEITYNASPNPNECWEAVQWGIEIPVGKGSDFFTMPYKALDSLKQKIGRREVFIEVRYFDEADESGAAGAVTKITLNGEVLYKEE